MLYHVTRAENVESILKYGLKAQIGENSQSVLEEHSAVFLCDEASIPYWHIILGADAVIKVDVDSRLCEEFQYSLYKEFICPNDISADNIELCIGYSCADKEAMRNLCASFVYTLGSLMVRIARYYDNPDVWDGNSEEASQQRKFLKGDICSLLTVFKRLDYSVCDMNDICSELVEAGESGEYTFADTYKNSDKRLWEMLDQYPCDEMEEDRKNLKNLISSSLSECLYVETGGWQDF